MNNDLPISFIPRTPDEELRLQRSVPIALSDSSAVVINSAGITRVDGDLTDLQVPDADEVLVSCGFLWALTYGDRLLVRMFHCSGKDFGELISKRHIELGTIPADSLLATASPTGVDVWTDSAAATRLLWTVTPDSFGSSSLKVSNRPTGTLSLRNSTLVGYRDDLGVQGVFYNFVDTVTGTHATYRSKFAFNAFGLTFVAADADPEHDEARHGIHVLEPDRETFLATSGPVVTGGGTDTSGAISVFTGTDCELFQLKVDGDGQMVLERVPEESGYKHLSPDGQVVSMRGYADEVTIKRLNKGTRPIVFPGAIPASHTVSLITNPGLSTGTVLHFHGGPESFEVPEPRIFGLPQYCRKNGWNWIGINYPGSISPDFGYTRKAWQQWRAAILGVVVPEIQATSGPIVLAGWSFGAALSLACASVSSRVKGILIGGCPGPISKHVERAIELDPNHKQWFQRRFDLDGDDAVFLNGEAGYRSDVKVLEFHGEEDEHCPIALSDEVADKWGAMGNPWERVRLPSKGHYAQTPEDAESIICGSRTFLQRVFTGVATD